MNSILWGGAVKAPPLLVYTTHKKKIPLMFYCVCEQSIHSIIMILLFKNKKIEHTLRDKI